MLNQQKVGAIIAAAGSSRRMGGKDKIFALLGEKSVLSHVIDVFQCCEHVDTIALVVSESNMDRARDLVGRRSGPKPVAVCPGGSRRQDSVAAGLGRLGGCRWVVVHDGARPFVTVELIERGLEAAAETGAAVAALPVTDTIKTAGADLIVRETVPRGDLWAVQTPQVFRADILAGAFRQTETDVTDEASLVEQAGYRVKLYQGARDNIKITTSDDLTVAAALWERRRR